ncbi:glycoside hydrolase family 15 protein [Clostridium omnivorum]|uniref:glycoside hydrolase family 15 protein n=1 Tax=Clostridium omnivorum TaxID=1604902 RepID=UPI0022312A90|nr:glycoside hydrolase family 15 protein [Clostridium sp. E14]
MTNQHSSGSYVASPNFSTYNYCWLRDGSFTAYSMDLYGEFNSSIKFFNWANVLIEKQQDKLKKILDMKKRGDILLNDDYLPTWFMLDGNNCDEEWPNFQLDGYGEWLWALSQHLKLAENDNDIAKYKKSIDVATEYLCCFWNYPCFNCWQEDGEKIHTSTLAAIYGGLNSINEYLNDSYIESTLKDIKQYVLDNCIEDNRLKKCTDLNSTDANLLWAATPFKLFKVNDLIIKNTVNIIEKELVHEGGVHRYPEDTYYGGGEWTILSAWLGLYYCEINEVEKAGKMLRWIESKANINGELAEQVLDNVNDDYYINKWESLWGEVASPLLWSHAMYLILLNSINKLSLLSVNNTIK